MEIRLLSLLKLAIKYGASDIHFEKKYDEVTIDMRINGEFKRVKSKLGDEKLIRYLGYLANIDVGKPYEPQTGEFELEVDGSLVKLRFAIINSVDTSSGVLRILNKNHSSKDLNEDDNIKKFVEGVQNPISQGSIYIISGKVGSGKTTLAYNILKTLKNKHVYTLEDPIEVYIDDFVQLQINEETGFNVKEGVKQILRHDPDVLYLEIRDAESAKAALMASSFCTVLTTIHTSSCEGVIGCEEAIKKMIELGANKEQLLDRLGLVINVDLQEKDGKKTLVGKSLYRIIKND